MNSLFKIITNNADNTDLTILNQSIMVQDLEITMFIGVEDVEKQNKQRVIVNIDLEIDETSKPKSDNINEVICYAGLVENVKSLATQKHYELVETFTHDIASMCLASGEQAQQVTVSVQKPDILDDVNVGVTITAIK